MMQGGIGGVHGGVEGGVRAGAGADSGGAGRGAVPAARDGGGAGRQRRGGAGEPLPALPAAAAGGLRRDGVRGAHGPADHLRALVQPHCGPADQAPGRQVGPRAPHTGIPLRQRRRLAAGSDERAVKEREAPGGGAGAGAGWRAVPAVRDLLRRAGAVAADRAAAAGDAGRGAEPVPGVHVGRVQARHVQDPPRRPPPRALRAARQHQRRQQARRARGGQRGPGALQRRQRLRHAAAAAGGAGALDYAGFGLDMVSSAKASSPPRLSCCCSLVHAPWSRSAPGSLSRSSDPSLLFNPYRVTEM
uniref:Uncharacterized protein n=1 Tax=Zea mays TaxID=4577 RepID=A0A804Q3M4_MAIZE